MLQSATQIRFGHHLLGSIELIVAIARAVDASITGSYPHSPAAVGLWPYCAFLPIWKCNWNCAVVACVAGHFHKAARRQQRNESEALSGQHDGRLSQPVTFLFG